MIARGGIRTCAGQDLATAFRNFHGQPDHLLAFFVRKRRRFARGAHRNNAGNSGGDLRFDQFFESGKVECAIVETA